MIKINLILQKLLKLCNDYNINDEMVQDILKFIEENDDSHSFKRINYNKKSEYWKDYCKDDNKHTYDETWNYNENICKLCDYKRPTFSIINEIDHQKCPKCNNLLKLINNQYNIYYCNECKESLKGYITHHNLKLSNN